MAKTKLMCAFKEKIKDMAKTKLMCAFKALQNIN